MKRQRDAAVRRERPNARYALQEEFLEKELVSLESAVCRVEAREREEIVNDGTQPSSLVTHVHARALIFGGCARTPQGHAGPRTYARNESTRHVRVCRPD